MIYHSSLSSLLTHDSNHGPKRKTLVLAILNKAVPYFLSFVHSLMTLPRKPILKVRIFSIITMCNHL